MACSKSLPQASAVLTTFSATANFHPLGGWMPSTGLSKVDFAMRMGNVVGNIECKPAYMLAVVRTELPSTPSAITAGSYANSGLTHYQETVNDGAYFWLRPGVMYKNSTGTALGTCEVWLDVAPFACGKMVGSKNIMVNPGVVTSTDSNYAEISGWLPAVGLDKIKAAIVVMDNESDYLEYQLVIRTAVDPRIPNAWQTAEASWDNPSSTNSVRNTGVLSVPAGANISSNQVFQLGIAFRKKSGAGGNPRAMIVAMGAVSFA